MSTHRTFYVTAYYTAYEDEADLTDSDLMSRLIGYGFTEVDVEVEDEGGAA